MRKIIYFAALLLCCISCKDEAHVWVYEDMIYFLDSDLPSEGWVEPVTQMTAAAQSKVDLLVARNGFAATNHPKQTVNIVVVEELSTAVPGVDFTLSAQTAVFKNKGMVMLPLQVDILDGAAGKKIVLQLDYGYYDECVLEGRKSNKLVIDLQ